MNKKKKVSFATSDSPHLPSDETIIASDCKTHRFIGRDGVCQATDCLVRKGNIERYLGECRLYNRLTSP